MASAGATLAEGEAARSDSYYCPVYKSSARAGALSSTGKSTNYLLSIGLPIVQPSRREALDRTKEETAAHWTLRGTALVL